MTVTIAAALVPTDSGASDFLSDVAAMLERIAEDAGLSLTRSPERTSTRTWFVEDRDVIPRALLPEFGIHRGQLARAPVGRIHSYKVAVALSMPGGEPYDGSIIRTYNYPQQRVSFHRAGTRAALADVLAGRVRDPGSSPPANRRR